MQAHVNKISFNWISLLVLESLAQFKAKRRLSHQLPLETSAQNNRILQRCSSLPVKTSQHFDSDNDAFRMKTIPADYMIEAGSSSHDDTNCNQKLLIPYDKLLLSEKVSWAQSIPETASE